MNVLFISHFFYPHIGGVEKHVKEVGLSLRKEEHKITVLTEKYDNKLKNKEAVDGIRVIRFSYPHLKFFGLIFIWVNIWKQRRLIMESDVIHIHDVFIWYLPFRLLFPDKKVYTTFHGWEGVYPIPQKNIWLKQIATKLSCGTIAVGKYIEKYYKIKANKIVYGGTDISLYTDISGRGKKSFKKNYNKVVFVGRLEKDTGVLKFLKRLDDFKYKDVEFVGDGPLRNICKKYGKVNGFCDPLPFYKTAEYVVPAGYLSYIEAVSNSCKIITYEDNPLKKAYWDEIKKIKKFMSWKEVSDVYLNLWTV